MPSAIFYIYIACVSLPIKCLCWSPLVISVISPEVMDKTQNEGDTVSFTCQVASEPVPLIRWYFNGALVDDTNTAKYSISMMSFNTTTNSTLIIRNVQSSDVGTYTCNATNVVSTDTSSGTLTVNGKLYCMYFIIIKFYDSCSYHYYTNGRTSNKYHRRK